MLHVKVDKGDPTDLYEQVAADIRRAIADGEAKPGERLPPAKDLAVVLGVNANTVLRALRLLRDEGLLDRRQQDPRTRRVRSPTRLQRRRADPSHAGRHLTHHIDTATPATPNARSVAVRHAEGQVRVWSRTRAGRPAVIG
jgi:DNA-binding transcriptional regulator YhcF (GntR family)